MFVSSSRHEIWPWKVQYSTPECCGPSVGLVIDQLAIVCSFEACHEKTRMRQDDFLRIVSALKAGQPQKAQEIWDSVKAGQEQMGGERSGQSERTVRKAVAVEQSHAPASDGSVNPPGDNVHLHSRGSQSASCLAQSLCQLCTCTMTWDIHCMCRSGQSAIASSKRPNVRAVHSPGLENYLSE